MKTDNRIIFEHWFNRYGHWLYGCGDNGFKKAIFAWMNQGIDGLPTYHKDDAPEYTNISHKEIYGW